MPRIYTPGQLERKRLQGRAWRQNPSTVAYQKRYQRERRERVRDEKRAAVDRLKTAPCQDCGVTFNPVCMDFDHRPGTEKIDSVAMMVSATRVSLDAVLAEIAKCDLVCANCHRIRTHRTRSHRAQCEARIGERSTQTSLDLGGES